jgi:hypothetical protein
MKATIRIAWWRVGHASGPTSKIRWRRLNHRRLVSVGASLDADAIAGGPPAAAGAALLRVPQGRLAYHP